MTIDRRALVLAGGGFAALGAAPAAALERGEAMGGVGPRTKPYSPGPDPEPFSEVEVVSAASTFFGVAAQTIAGVIERVFRDEGRPTGYIAGTEVSGAVVVGLRYGKGLLYMKHQRPETVFWQGPSAGFDFGADGSRVFTLVYGIRSPGAIFHRFPGVDGSIYLVAGFGVNYQRDHAITLAPIRTGVGARAGANVGYLAYSRTRHLNPF